MNIFYNVLFQVYFLIKSVYYILDIHCSIIYGPTLFNIKLLKKTKFQLTKYGINEVMVLWT